MKRSELIRHLSKYGCELVREGGRHSIWKNKPILSSVGLHLFAIQHIDAINVGLETASAYAANVLKYL